MIIYAIFIVADDGRTLLAEHFRTPDEKSNDILFGGLITALQGMASTVAQGEMNTIEIEGLSYHIRTFSFFRVVLVTNTVTTPDNIIQILGHRFLNEYGDILTDWDSNLNVFLPFKETITEVLKRFFAVDTSKSIDPLKKFTTADIFALSHELHATALALLTLVEGTVLEIATESGESEEITHQKLKKLQEMGYIGKKEIEEEILFFCSV